MERLRPVQPDAQVALDRQPANGFLIASALADLLRWNKFGTRDHFGGIAAVLSKHSSLLQFSLQCRLHRVFEHLAPLGG